MSGAQKVYVYGIAYAILKTQLRWCVHAAVRNVLRRSALYMWQQDACSRLPA